MPLECADTHEWSAEAKFKSTDWDLELDLPVSGFVLNVRYRLTA